MLSQDILAAVKGYTENLTQQVTLVLQTGVHEQRAELYAFLRDISNVSDLINFVERDSNLRSPISFSIENEQGDTGIRFSGIPGGHEFNSLILAILQAGGHTLKLDGAMQRLVQAIDEPLHFEVFISLSCHNCPDVVQALNQFALLNNKIETEMIDGALFQKTVEARAIQGVPAV
ncbi:thioredoxin family protein, partial [Litorivivens sp.]